MKVVHAHEVKGLVMKYAIFQLGHVAAVTEGLNNADVLSITKDKLTVEYEIKVSRGDLSSELAAIRYAMMTMKEGKKLGPASLGPEQEQLNLEFAVLKRKAAGWSKISKHQQYLDRTKYIESQGISKYTSYRYVPSYFYLVVPNSLVSYAIENTLGTGYGVIAYDGCRQEGEHSGYFKDGEWFGRWGTRPSDAVWKHGAPCSEDCTRGIAVKQQARRLCEAIVDDWALMAILNRACVENLMMLDELVQLDAASRRW